METLIAAPTLMVTSESNQSRLAAINQSEVSGVYDKPLASLQEGA